MKVRVIYDWDAPEYDNDEQGAELVIEVDAINEDAIKARIAAEVAEELVDPELIEFDGAEPASASDVTVTIVSITQL